MVIKDWNLGENNTNKIMVECNLSKLIFSNVIVYNSIGCLLDYAFDIAYTNNSSTDNERSTYHGFTSWKCIMD